MRRPYLSLCLFCILLIALTLAPQSVLAEGDPPPTPQPVQPPWITGQNTRVSPGGEYPAEIVPSGIAESAPAAVESPALVGLAPQALSAPAPGLAELAVPQRYQDPDDPTCGAAALGMVLEFLSLSQGGDAPDTGRLVQDLKSTGLLYESGTGVEELAYLARAYGYRGASPVHGWTLEKLAGELAAGRPAVVSLGLNGGGQPGHFVTVTGMAADGSWVRYNDPVLGQQTVSADEFLAAWGSQGYSGLTVRKGALAAASDPLLPWMGLLGAVSTLAVLSKHYPLGSDLKKLLSLLQGALGNPTRPGLGGKLEPVYELKKVQVGTQTVTDYSRKIPEYTTRWVQKGVKTITDYSRKIYEYGTRWVQKGVKTVTDYSRKISEYGTRWVQKGWKTVKDTSRKIYEYGTRWVTKGWQKVTSWAKGIWGWFKKTQWVPKKVKETFVKGWHYATKKVPQMVKETFVKGWHYATRTVPNLVEETFVKGWHYATRTVPNLVKETVQDGWHYATKEVPKYAWQQVQTGWRNVQNSFTGLQTPTPEPPPTPEEPTLTGTPVPPSPVANTPALPDQEAKELFPDGNISENPTDPQQMVDDVIAQLPSELAELIGNEDIAKALQEVDSLPELKIILPWLTDMGMDDVFSGPLVKNIDTDDALRALGRLIGDPLLTPIGIAAGWGLTLYPEIKNNVRLGEPAANYASDIIIDSAGFWSGEAAGWIVGILSAPVVGETGIGPYLVKLGGDVTAGIVYDGVIDATESREKLTEYIQSQFEHDGIPTSATEDILQAVPHPAPPVQEDATTITTIPDFESGEPTGTPFPADPEASNTIIPPVVTQTPEPFTSP